ncbi:hypothetical protein BD626DRAFT_400551 [Schizophyllum amplum]|uniref:RING-type domain-containing protein n=1 Tax=Schizophyllum amplum TaxID=97359 RepID=A0A550CIN9_9AGAR|nr:hypothetical protein BD626DRAFT_400551 [Auriculariopsis ampla]
MSENGGDDAPLPAPITSRNREPRSRAASLVRAARSATSSRSRSRASSLTSIDLTDDTSSAVSAISSKKRKRQPTTRTGRPKRSRRITAETPDADIAFAAEGASEIAGPSGLSAEVSSSNAVFDLSFGSGDGDEVHPLPAQPDDYDEVETLPDIGLGTPPPADSSNKGKGKQRAIATPEPSETDAPGAATVDAPPPSPKAQTSLAEYTCPICFFAPTNATLTPCGHICCGSCLFTAVKTAMIRSAHTPEGLEARCPVCRAVIPGWDGYGGGVIGLKLRSKVTIDV